MRNLIRDIFLPESNIEEIVMQILHDLKIRVNRTTISQHLNNHPFFPSLLSVQDVISNYGIVSECRKASITDIFQSSLPLYALIQVILEDRNFFALLYKYGESTMEWYNPFTHKRERITQENLNKVFSGYIMLFDDSNKRDEEEYVYKSLREWFKYFIKTCVVLFPVSLCVFSLFNHTKYLYIILSVFYLLGGTLSFVIFSFEFKGIPIKISRLCNFNSHVSCVHTLGSKESYFGGIPWSIIGVSYFMGMLSAICLTGFSSQSLVLAAYIHISTLCFSLYSIYYQTLTVRKWCPLCLAIQIICLTIFIHLLAGGYYQALEGNVSLSELFTMAFAVVMTFSVFYCFFSYSKEHKTNLQNTYNLNYFKYKKEVFHTLLCMGKEIQKPLDNIGIILGNPKGKIHIIEVCNLYCIHCAEAQTVLHEIIKSNADIKLQIIFTSFSEEQHYKDILRAFLALYYDGYNMEEVFSEWFKSKDINKQMTKMHDSIEENEKLLIEENIINMNNFCMTQKIQWTPTIFINEYILGEMYSAEDLKYFY